MYLARLLLLAVALCSLAAPSLRAQEPPADIPALLAVLQGNAPQQAKADACRRLGMAGAKEAVPALSALLADPPLAAHARTALENIPDPSAGAALREALTRLDGALLVGVIGSLGARREVSAVPALTRLAKSNQEEITSAALTALGRIGTNEAVSALQPALASKSSVIKNAAADALLAVADSRLRQGRSAEALRVLEAVRASSAPRSMRLAAAGLAIVAQGEAGLPLLIRLLRSAEPGSRQVALQAARQVRAAGLGRALTEEYARAQPDLQVLLVGVARDRTGPEGLRALETMATSGSQEGQLAALAALGEVGDSSCVPLLVRTALNAPETLSAAAIASLTRLPVRQVDEALVASLEAAKPAVRVRLIEALGRRRASAAAPSVLRYAGGADAAASRAAFAALARIARPQDLAELLQKTAACKDEEARSVGEEAVVATLGRVPDVGARTAAVLNAYNASESTEARAALLRVLGEVGTYGALGALKARLDDAEPAIRLAAVRALAEWHDLAPVETLVGLVEAGRSPDERAAALRGATRMMAAVLEECPSTPAQLLQWLRRLAAAVRPDAGERRLLLSALGNVKSIGGLLLVRPLLSDASVEPEAVQAALRIAQNLRGPERGMAKSVLNAHMQATSNPELRARLQEAAAAITEAAAEPVEPAAVTGEVDTAALAFRPLFDGSSFEGWDGAGTGAFRIEGGAIVGGGLNLVLPANEFVCTTRPYANFVLRAECKVTGTNGGIQIRSSRVPRSLAVSGYQADLNAEGQYWGCLYDEQRRGMLAQIPAAMLAQSLKKDDWNQYEIRCEGPRIRLYVNGILTVDYTEKDPSIPQIGIIGLQIHGGMKGETWYRNLQIAELP